MHTTEAAHTAGVTRDTIRTWCRTGAVAAAPGPVPELFLWETPRVLGRSARSLRAHLDKRLS